MAKKYEGNNEIIEILKKGENKIDEWFIEMTKELKKRY